jgi:undecaprenyl diphosphate synthase
MALLGKNILEQDEFFSIEDLACFDSSRGPSHVAIMMDGNRRWSSQQGKQPIVGHWEGTEALTRIVRAAIQLNIRTLTVFAFSTENWKRSETEVVSLMQIFEAYLIQKKKLMIEEGIRLDAIGDLSRLPAQVLQAFYQAREATRHCEAINLVLALNYGGRDEIRRAFGRLLAQHEEKKIAPAELTEALIGQCMDTYPWGDPDLLIRTSGEMRVSNFLLWQISYSEFYVTDVLWPAFTPQELLRAVLAYQSRHRRQGG